MSTLPYPRNVQSIVQGRQNGMKPAGPVMVILTDRYEAIQGDAILSKAMPAHSPAARVYAVPTSGLFSTMAATSLLLSSP